MKLVAPGPGTFTRERDMDTETRPTIPPGPYEAEWDTDNQHYLVRIGGSVYIAELEAVKGVFPAGTLWKADRAQLERVMTYLWGTGELRLAPNPFEAGQVDPVGDFMLEAGQALAPVLNIVLDAAAPGDDRWFTFSVKVRRAGDGAVLTTAMSLIPEEGSNLRGSCPWSPPPS